MNAINHKLMSLEVEEDRLVGPYFIKPDEVGSSKAADKLLLYLWDDVLRHKRDQFFNHDILTFSDLSEKFYKMDVFDLFDSEYASYLKIRDSIHDNSESEGESIDA